MAIETCSAADRRGMKSLRRGSGQWLGECSSVSGLVRGIVVGDASYHHGDQDREREPDGTLLFCVALKRFDGSQDCGALEPSGRNEVERGEGENGCDPRGRTVRFFQD